MAGIDLPEQRRAVLTIPLEKLGYIIAKAREYDAEVAPADGLDRGSVSEDDASAILQSTIDNPIRQELRAAIDNLNDDERSELVALMWLGRDDFDAKDWADGLRQARQTRRSRTSRYLVGTPLLSDYLEEGMARLGYSPEDATADRL